jgi:hypothetical protein
MGDIADYTLECIDWETEPIGRTIPICKYCGKQCFKWDVIANEWVLYEKHKIHKCPKHSLPLEVLKELVKQNMENLRKNKK